MLRSAPALAVGKLRRGRHLASDLVAALKQLITAISTSNADSGIRSSTSVSRHHRSGQQLHALAHKSDLEASNVFVANSLINFYGKLRLNNEARSLFDASSGIRDSASWNTMLCAYVKSQRLDDACELFAEMPPYLRDCVSYTTVIMGHAQGGIPMEAMMLFREMRDADVSPNDVTLAHVMSACAAAHSDADSHSHPSFDFCATANAIHALVIRIGLLEISVLVSTNLVHMYAATGCIRAAESVFEATAASEQRNTVTWNAMLNGYCKSGGGGRHDGIDSARRLFDRMPDSCKDVVTWCTMIDGYQRANRLREALLLYRDMLSLGGTAEKPNEVIAVDLLSACARHSAFLEGVQFHCSIIKRGFDSYGFVMTTVIHFYSECGQIEYAQLQFQQTLGTSGKVQEDGLSVSAWNALLAGFLRNGMLDSARDLFDQMPYKDVVSWSTMISGHTHNGQHESALHLFHEMLAQGLRPSHVTMISVVSAMADADSVTIEQARWIHDFIKANAIPVDDNLGAALIDLYSKCGSIPTALTTFQELLLRCNARGGGGDGSRRRALSICPWNALICGLAMHGDASMALDVFRDMQQRTTGAAAPNSITFIGVLTACCHAGLVDEGRAHFESMTNVHGIQPNLKHYGCMVDLLGRAGRLQEAMDLIRSMPMEPDVVIWGSLLAASKTHGDVEIGKLAASNLAKLQPHHGAGRVLLSNIYANAGNWEDVFLVRSNMQGLKMVKTPGRSGVS